MLHYVQVFVHSINNDPIEIKSTMDWCKMKNLNTKLFMK